MSGWALSVLQTRIGFSGFPFPESVDASSLTLGMVATPSSSALSMIQQSMSLASMDICLNDDSQRHLRAQDFRHGFMPHPPASPPHSGRPCRSSA